MLPVTDLHFAFCGIATVAATIGYAYSRKAGPTTSPSTNPTKADVEAGLLPLPEEQSLKKRKLDDPDSVESDQDELSRPMKRSRTPPSADSGLGDGDGDEWEVIVAPPAYEEAVAPPQQQVEHVQQSTITHTQKSEIVPSHRPATTPDREPTPPVIVDVPEVVEQQTVENKQQERQADPHVDTSQPNEVPSATLTTSPPKTPPQPRRPNPFSTFSTSNSPFASYSSHGRSSFGLPADTVTATPAWRRGKERSFDAALADASPGSALAPSPNDLFARHKGGSSSSSPSSSSSSSTLKTTTHAIQPATQTKVRTSSQGETHELSKQPSHLTGEEDESISSELKGVKLFIKRGRKEFTDGMYGHVKVLSLSEVPSCPNDGCETDPDTAADTKKKNERTRSRILFRRDPLGQVSMNVALRPTVRCHFDAAENILRIILKERVDAFSASSSDTGRTGDAEGKDKQERESETDVGTDVVVYALKPGRSPKAEFQTFARSLCASQEVQREVEAGTAGGEA